MYDNRNQSKGNLVSRFRIIANKVFHLANSGIARIKFMEQITSMLIDFSRCDSVEIYLVENDSFNIWCNSKINNRMIFSDTRYYYEELKTIDEYYSNFEKNKHLLSFGILKKKFSFSNTEFTPYGSFWINDTSKKIFLSRTSDEGLKEEFDLSSDYNSYTIIPILIYDELIGLLHLKSLQKDFFRNDEIDLYEGIANSLGVAITHHVIQVALRERVKELTCLNGIFRIIEDKDLSLEDVFQRIVELLPHAWQYPEIAHARINIYDDSFTNIDFKQGKHKQSVDILIDNEKVGSIEIFYIDDVPQSDEGPFLKEESALLHNVSKEISLMVERRQIEEEKQRIQNLLLHADRLATIGQLAAGVAHELNEPLNNILGFAQLIKKNSELSEQNENDLNRIINSSLHAREVVKKLLFFGRQMPTRKAKMNLNMIVEDGLYFLESRCKRENIRLTKALCKDLPEIEADSSQLHQVLVNLVVNAIQAMPKGGNLLISTNIKNNMISLIVEDTGIGMSKDIIRQIFIPFFTTKEVGQGTGLGLPVVHGIVTSHGGSINIESEVDIGSKIEILLPFYQK